MAEPLVVVRDAPPATVDDVANSLYRLAGLIKSAGTGTQAALRRHHPWRESAASLFDAERLMLRAGIAADDVARERWLLVLHVLAIVRGRHDVYGAEAGLVLWREGFSELRVKQLIEADIDQLADLLPRIALRLAATGASLNWRPLAELLLYTGTPQALRADRARRRIVEHYLGAQPRGEEDGSDD